MQFDDLEDEYRALFGAAVILPSKRTEVVATARRIANARPRYDQVSRRTGVPWFVVGILHAMHVEMDFSRTLTGQSIRDADWEDQATIAVADLKGPWNSVESIAYALEKWNGWGYRKRGIHTPYLWGLTNVQGVGLYVTDETFVPTAYPDRPGAMALLRALLDVDARSVDLIVPPKVHVWAKAPAPAGRSLSSIWLFGAFLLLVSISLAATGYSIHRRVMAYAVQSVTEQAEQASASQAAEIQRLRDELAAAREVKEEPKPVARPRPSPKPKKVAPQSSWPF